MPYRGGAAKALRAMQKQYGTKRGTAIFHAKAGGGGHAKAQSYYKKGGKQR